LGKPFAKILESAFKVGWPGALALAGGAFGGSRELKSRIFQESFRPLSVVEMAAVTAARIGIKSKIVLANIQKWCEAPFFAESRAACRFAVSLFDRSMPMTAEGS